MRSRQSIAPRMAVSGPMPAGSPVVMAIMGFAIVSLDCSDGIQRKPDPVTGVAILRFLRQSCVP